MGNLKRKQIYLDEASDLALKRLATSTNTTESEHIRRAIRKYVKKQESMSSEKDPLLNIIGLCKEPIGPKDASVNHDKYLYGQKASE